MIILKNSLFYDSKLLQYSCTEEEESEGLVDEEELEWLGGKPLVHPVGQIRLQPLKQQQEATAFTYDLSK